MYPGNTGAVGSRGGEKGAGAHTQGTRQGMYREQLKKYPWRMGMGMAIDVTYFYSPIESSVIAFFRFVTFLKHSIQ